MRVLLDTHIILWALENNIKLSAKAKVDDLTFIIYYP